MAKNLVRLSAAAKIYNCTRWNVAKAAKPPKGPLFPAIVMVDGQERLDLNHKAARNWRQEHRLGADELATPEIETLGGGGIELESQIRKYWSYTLQDIIEKHGTMPIFASLLQAASKIEAIHAQRLTSDRSTGELISRAYVKSHVVGLIERVNNRLLTDMPAKLAQEVYAACATAATLEDIQQLIHDAVSGELKTVKGDAKKAIRKAKD